MNSPRQQELTRLRNVALAQPEILQGHVRYLEEALKLEMRSDVAEYLLEFVDGTRNWPQLHCDVVLALEKQGHGRLVHESMCAVSAEHPHGPIVGYLLGVHLSIRRDYERAEIGLKAALKHMPDLAAAHFFLGVVYQQQRDFGKAAAECHAALALSPRMAEPYFALGVMEAQNGNMDSASANMRAFLDRAGLYLASYKMAAQMQLQITGG